jgi:hypothetical protein
MIIRNLFNISVVIISACFLVSCGKATVITELFDTNISCDEPKPYQSVVVHERVVSPEGLDQLDETKELQVPESSTSESLTSECIDYPPVIGSK